MNHGPDFTRSTAVIGLQWGDEGKGKVVDLLARDHDVIVRYNGGANAGHSIVIGGERYALHLIPVGILSADRTCVIANGVVVDPVKLLSEIDGLRSRGVEVGSNLRLSDRAHVVMPWHAEMDACLEGSEGGGIGTTRRGIGPAYADKAYRSMAIRVQDLLERDRLRERLEAIAPIRGAQLRALGSTAPDIDTGALLETYLGVGERLRPFVTDTVWLLHDLVRAGRRLLFEGANATLLDVDHGTYPFVTSSHCSTLGIPAGTGLPGACAGRIIGIMKAYATRVGGGPFPTEEHGPDGHRIRERGREYGTTTGRPRRCGWLDLVAVRYAAMISGATTLAVMLLDVLSGFDEIRVATRYRLPDGSSTDRFPPDARTLARVTPIYETLPGWSEPIESITDRPRLPENARRYLDLIERTVGTPITIVSVGPDRRQTLVPAGAAP